MEMVINNLTPLLAKKPINKLVLISTHMFENTVPNKANINLGSYDKIWLFENITQTVVIINNPPNGYRGRIASKNGRILPVLFL